MPESALKEAPATSSSELTAEQIHALLEVAVRSRMERAALLFGLPAELVAVLPRSNIPRDQLMLDLERLNGLSEVAGVQGAPLARWLLNLRGGALEARDRALVQALIDRLAPSLQSAVVPGQPPAAAPPGRSGRDGTLWLGGVASASFAALLGWPGGANGSGAVAWGPGISLWIGGVFLLAARGGLEAGPLLDSPEGPERHRRLWLALGARLIGGSPAAAGGGGRRSWIWTTLILLGVYGASLPLGVGDAVSVPLLWGALGGLMCGGVALAAVHRWRWAGPPIAVLAAWVGSGLGRLGLVEGYGVEDWREALAVLGTVDFAYPPSWSLAALPLGVLGTRVAIQVAVQVPGRPARLRVVGLIGVSLGLVWAVLIRVLGAASP